MEVAPHPHCALCWDVLAERLGSGPFAEIDTRDQAHRAARRRHHTVTGDTQ